MGFALSFGVRISAAYALIFASVSCGGDDTTSPQGSPQACGLGERMIDGKGCIAAGVQDNGCPAGTLGLEDGTCRPAGIPPEMCAEGFAPDGRGGCDAILPAEPCPKGLMAVPGETRCREVAPCAEGTWGDVPVAQTTQYVDAQYAAAGSDGSAAKPWTTIQQGVDAAEPDAIVAVAAGSYAQDVVIADKPVQLWGRCPKLVEIVGVSLDAVRIKKGASGSAVRDLALRGAGYGLELSGSDNVVVDRVWIHDAAAPGLQVLNILGATSLELSRSLIEHNGTTGVVVSASQATIDATVVRDTQPQASDQRLGAGISIQADAASGEPATGTVRGSLVEGNRQAGVVVAGSVATIEATVVRRTQPEAFDQRFGHGIAIFSEPSTPRGRASAIVRSSVVYGNREWGVSALGSDVTIEATVIRDTEPEVLGAAYGAGILIQDDDLTHERGNGTVRTSLVEGNRWAGVIVYGSDATIEGSIVRDTQPQASDQQYGAGIFVTLDLLTTEPSSATVRGSSIERNRVAGVIVSGSEAAIESTVISETQAADDGSFGDAVLVSFSGLEVAVQASATISSCFLGGSVRAGISSFAGTVAVASTSLDCNGIALDGESFPEFGLMSSFEDAGGNACGCGDERDVCAVLSSGIVAPEPPAPPM